MIFWDSSAIVPLLAEEAASPPMPAIALASPDMLVWWGTIVECASSPAQRSQIDISPSGLHWENLDEDSSMAGFLEGRAVPGRTRRRARS